MDYFERKKLKQEAQNYRTMCWVLAVIIVTIGILWYLSDNSKTRTINKLQEEIEILKEESGE